MQRKKTGRLFKFCLQSTAIVANKSKKQMKILGEIGKK